MPRHNLLPGTDFWGGEEVVIIQLEMLPLLQNPIATDAATATAILLI